MYGVIRLFPAGGDAGPLLAVLDALDRVAAAPLALLGDHIAFRFERTATPAPEDA